MKKKEIAVDIAQTIIDELAGSDWRDFAGDGALIELRKYGADIAGTIYRALKPCDFVPDDIQDYFTDQEY